MDLPDPEKWQRVLHGWVDIVKSLWRFAGFILGGFALAGALGLRAEPRLLHLMGIPSTLTFADSPIGWGIVALVGIGVSLWVVGKRIYAQSVHESRMKRDLVPVLAWHKSKAADEALAPEDITIRDLVLEVSDGPQGSKVNISMNVVNLSKDNVAVNGVCVDWVRAADSTPLIPHRLCVLPSERKEVKDSEQVANSFEIARHVAAASSGDAWVSFGYTRHGVHWKHWGKAVNASIQ